MVNHIYYQEFNHMVKEYLNPLYFMNINMVIKYQSIESYWELHHMIYKLYHHIYFSQYYCPNLMILFKIRHFF